MSSIRKTRYGDLYDRAYRWRQTGGCVSRFVIRVMAEFKAQPMRLSRVPKHIDTLVRTQSIASGVLAQNFIGFDEIRRALKLVRLMERRAAKLIVVQARHFLYRAGPLPGPMFLIDLARIRSDGGFFIK